MSPFQSDAFVFFGATGDLAYKQIFPALQAMMRDGHLDMPVIGLGKEAWSIDQFIARARQSIESHATLDEPVFKKLAARLQYIGGDYQDDATYRQLRTALGDAAHPLHYLAVPPELFEAVATGLSRSGCAKNARLVVEKPFGRDLPSAQALNRLLARHFPPSDIFRIDHFLGKEAVQNLLYFRLANTFLGAVWHRDYVASVQINMAEAFGVAGRGGFYETVGAIRDVVQNHLLQVVSLLAMEPPAGNHPDALREAKLRVFEAMQPISPAHAVRGQFHGYRNEPGVAAESQVETFVALRLCIDNERWRGVPFYIRAGKQLPVSATEVVVTLKTPTPAVFDTAAPGKANYLRYRIDPDVLIAIGTRTKIPGEAMAGEISEIVAHRHPGDEMLPYERLLGDALRGDATLFAHYDSIEAAWRAVTPILGNAVPVQLYDPQTWGPAKADEIVAGTGGWHNPISPEENDGGAR
ncbi:glucose 6-phosphate dehydrogenase [Pandoraea thiooxydans]|uniref:Glucose-6-phosphate 1-dehydrogenase n=1 Tax=Pandoraea thiooxydans TaxID=445709 RepID=A0A0G3EPR8_9BURK|nr:glucose-6-phosphate dehydrogenase [Pandoraea thiooxydans]AKJ68004.1 glucose-6-phosphate dehydrogenase [Pandoraea thiooxydans]APR95231.1 glucose 6-phosphate dehydrogenase [Pandoraea thiooxydans]